MDDFRMPTKIGLECIGAHGTIGRLISGTDGATFKLKRLIGQRVRLQLVDHLQLVLDVSKKQVGDQQGVALLR